MPVSIEMMPTCASTFADFKCESSDGSKIYMLQTNGPEGQIFCDCPAGKHNRECKHVKRLWEEACLFNPQWHDGGKAEWKPVGYDFHDFLEGEECPNCKGPMIAVKYAV